MEVGMEMGMEVGMEVGMEGVEVGMAGDLEEHVKYRGIQQGETMILYLLVNISTSGRTLSC